MAKDMPFDEDIMTLIMGVEPSEPGQHGRTKAPKPDKDAVGVIMEIRDLCEEFLSRAGKDTEEKEKPEEPVDEEVEEDER